RERTKVAAQKWIAVMPTGSTPTTKVTGEGAGAWVENWLRERELEGLTSVRENRSHWEHHLAQHLGAQHPRTWTRDQFRKLSALLDDKVREGRLSWKTAVNVWGTATRMCDDA